MPTSMLNHSVDVEFSIPHLDFINFQTFDLLEFPRLISKTIKLLLSMEDNLHLDLKTTISVDSLHDQVFRDEPYRHRLILLPDKRTVVLEVIAKEARDQRRLPFYVFPPWVGLYCKEMVEPYGFPPKFNVHKDEGGKEGAELMIIFPLPNDSSNRCRKYRTLIWVNGNSVIRCLNNEGEKVALPPQLVYDMVCPFEEPAFEECAAWLKQHFGL